MKKVSKKTTKKTVAKKSLPPSYRTQAIHGDFQTRSWDFAYHLVPPMTSSTSFRLESLERGAQGFSSYGETLDPQQDPIFIYDRLQEPTTKMLEENLAHLEKGECAMSFASGKGAISSVFMLLLRSGHKVVAHRTLYGCTFSLLDKWLPNFDISHVLIDVNEASTLKKHLQDPSTRIVYFESMSNPLLEIADIEMIVKAVKKANQNRTEDNKIFVVVDNTFATPWALRPKEWGVDFVIESLTKNLSGFGTEMGGAVIADKKYEPTLRLARKDFGAIIHPYSAWHILVYGLSTQALRFEQQQKNAIQVAEFLSKCPQVEMIIYPGLKKFKQTVLAKKYLQSPEGQFSPGTMICFRIKGDEQACRKFVNHIATNSYSITLAVSLGLNKTLIEVPGLMTHSAISLEKQAEGGLDPKDIRLSIGLEHANDIIEDLKKSLKVL
ncbi:MAG: trans-sulfuration enzyme family protein [Pseudobdellovibrionaceae bacterium]